MIYTIEEIRQKVTEVSKRHPVERVYLFGSYARGEATEESDVDLRINLTKEMGLWEYAGIFMDYKDTLGKEIDIVTTNDTGNQKFMLRIKKDEVLLYEQVQ